MTDFTTPSLSPAGLPISDDAGGFSQSVQWDWNRPDAVLSPYMIEGRWITNVQGSITVTAANDNVQPMHVRVGPPRNGLTTLGYVDPGQTETFAIDLPNLEQLIEPDVEWEPNGMRILGFHFTQGSNGTGYTINDLDVVITSTDEDPNALLVVADSPSLSSADIDVLRFDDMLQHVTVDGQLLTDWLQGGFTGTRQAVIQLEGSLQNGIGVSFNTVTDIYRLYLDEGDNPAPGTYTQPYRVRLYNVTGGGEGGEEVETEITSFASGSDLTGVVTFELTEGGGGGEGGCSIPVFSRTIPSCG